MENAQIKVLEADLTDLAATLGLALSEIIERTDPLYKNPSSGPTIKQLERALHWVERLLDPPLVSPFSKMTPPPVDTIAIGQNIRRCRLDECLSRRDLANTSGLAVSAIEDFEAGKRNPSPAALYRMAVALRVTEVTLTQKLRDYPNAVLPE